jgi:two-component system cell cycle sensor histidine kinase/response regulator CckA
MLWCATQHPGARDFEYNHGILQPSPQTILLVDDELSVLTIVDTVLRRSGYHVIAVSDPLQAVPYSQNGDLRIDLLLTDIVMPQMDGPQLAELFGAASPTTKVLYMSGHASAAILARGLPANAQILQKPFAPKELVERVARMLATRAATASA